VDRATLTPGEIQLEGAFLRALQGAVKGESKVLWQNETAVALDPRGRLNVQHYNAISFLLTGPTGIAIGLQVQASDGERAGYANIPDTNGTQSITLTASSPAVLFDVTVGKVWVRVRITSVGSTPPFGAGWTLTATPYTAAGVQTLSQTVNANQNLNQVGGAVITEGQKLMAASVPMVIASDQSAIPVDGPDAAGGAATHAPVLTSGGDPSGNVRTIAVDTIGTVKILPFPGGTPVDGDTGVITDTLGHTVLAAPGAALKNYVTSLFVTNTSATGTLISLTGLLSGHTLHLIAPPNNGGMVVTLPVPLVCAVNTALTATCATTASSTTVSAVGYVAA